MAIVETLNNIGGIIGAVGIIVAIIFGALYGGKKAEKDKDVNTISTYEKNADALEKLLETRDKELHDLRILHESNLERIKLAESKAEVLEKQVTQAPSINKLIIQQSTQHKQMMTQMVKMTQELGNIAKSMPKTSIINVDGKEK